MKKFILFLVCSLMAFQTHSKVFNNDKEVLAYTTQQIDIVKSEMATLKLKLKVDKTNQNVISEIEVKKRELENLSKVKKYVKETIKLEEKTIKTFTKYEKLQKQLDSNKKQIEGIKIMLSSFDNIK